GLGLNFLAIPLMTIAQVAGMAVVPIALLSRTAAALVGWVAHMGADGLVGSANLVRYASFVSYRVAPPPWSLAAIYYAAGACWWALRRRRIDVQGSGEGRRAQVLRRAAASLAIAAGLWIVVDPRTLVARRGDGRLHVTFVDVGQGDSIFVVFPAGS